MRAIILAAGRGSRMKELTDNNPKCLLEIKGISLLQSQINSLKAAGIREIAIVTGYKNHMISEYGLTEFHNKRWEETQMFFSLSKANDWLTNFNCIISYSDIFYESEVISKLIQDKNNLAITYDVNWLKLWSKRFKNPIDDAESFNFNSFGFLTEIGNKVNDVKDIKGQYMGLIKTTPTGWGNLIKIYKSLDIHQQENIQITNILGKLIDLKKNYIKVIPINSKWGEVDTINDLRIYNES